MPTAPEIPTLNGALDPTYVGIPPALKGSLTETRDYFQGLDNFFRVFAIRPGERVMMLTDPLLDPRVVDAVSGLAKARGATVNVFMAPATTLPGIPDTLKLLARTSGRSRRSTRTW